QLRHRLPQEIDAFGGDFQRHERRTGEVPPWPREAVREAELDGIAADRDQDGKLTLGAKSPDGGPSRDDQGRLRLRHFLDLADERRRVAGAEPADDGEALALHVAVPPHAFSEALEEEVRLGV